MPGSLRLSSYSNSPAESGFATVPTSAPHREGSNLPIANRVVTMWNALLEKVHLRRREPSQPRMFSNTEVVSNETGVGCLDNAHVLRIDTGTSGHEEKPIHAHRTRSPSQGMPAGRVVYAAGQSPPAESFKDFLVQALASMQGVFEIVSRATHNDADRSTRNSVIDLLKTEIAKARSSNTVLMFGNRYAYQDLKQVGGKGHANDENDFLRYELTVIDRESGAEITVPLTQAGLKFTNKLLRPEQIRRANALLEAHQVAVESQPQTDQTALPAVQLVLSRAGVGRNATLITYQKFSRLIENGLVTEATLDALLEEEIDAGRMRRGPGYVHSLEQLASLRIALLDKMAEVALATAPELTEPSSLARVSAPIQQKIDSARAMLLPQQTTADRAPNTASDVTTLRLQSVEGDEKIEARTPDFGYQVVPRTSAESSTGPIQTQDQRPIATPVSIAPGAICEVDISVKSDGVVSHDGSSKPVQRTRYTNADINMERTDLLLSAARGGINQQRQLASDDGGSWWRAAFVSVLLEQATGSPNRTAVDAANKFAERIRGLRPDFTEEAALFKRMMLQLTNMFGILESPDGRGIGIRGFMTDLGPPKEGKAVSVAPQLFEGFISRLKAVGEEDNDPDRPGEKALKKIAHAMLLKAEFSADTVNGLFNEDSKEEGTEAHIVELMNQLGAREGIILTRPWVQLDSNPSAYSRRDYESMTLDVFAMNLPLGQKFDDDGVHKGDELRKFISAQANKPVIVKEHGRFSVLVSHEEASGGGFYDLEFAK